VTTWDVTGAGLSHLACLRDCGYVQVRPLGNGFDHYKVADPRAQIWIMLARSLASDNAAALAGLRAHHHGPQPASNGLRTNLTNLSAACQASGLVGVGT